MCAFRVDIDDAVARLRAGDCVAMPTETVYGLAGDARNETALQHIFALKGRPLSNPLIVHLHEVSDVPQWATGVTPAVRCLLDAFWPGPLTVVLPASASVSRLVTAGGDSVALRVPAHPLARELLARFGGGLCAPSANRSGYVSPVSAEHVLADYEQTPLAVLDGGVCPRGIESTIVRPRGEVLEVLRPGAIAVPELQRVWAGTVAYIARPEIAVPGSAPRHYAPRTPTQLVGRDALSSAGSDAAVVAIEPLPADCKAGKIVLLPAQPDAYAERLYTTLRTLDSEGFARILVERVPDNEHWLALTNRLGRAACPE